MSNGNNSNKISNMAQVGNFTKNAVQSFEQSIISRKNYLEQVKENQEIK